MIKYFVEQWEKIKKDLETYFKETTQNEYAGSYEQLTRVILDHINRHNGKELFITGDKDIKTIDYGDYQGTLIIIFASDTYQPDINETFYTSVYYGSCSGCDTLLGISGYEDGYPSDEQIKDYMSLALNIVQNIKCFGDCSWLEDKK